MRDGYAFVVIYELDSGTEGLALQEWLWRPELDWPSPPVKAVNSLASLGHPLRDTERVDLYGFRVGETDRGYWRVCASIHVPKSRLEQFRAKLPQVREVVERRLVGVPGREAIEQAQKRTVLQLDIRSALNDSFPGTPVRYVDVMIDEK